MDFKVCSQCGKEIEGAGVLFRENVFCGDECCDEFEEELSAKDVPSLNDLNKDGEDLLTGTDDDLGYRDDNDLDDDVDDDGFNIDEDDF